MFRIRCLVCIFSSIHLTSSQDSYKYYVLDNTGANDKDKLRSLAYELIKEAKNKIMQVDGIKDEASMFTAFAVGTIIGRIREKYRSMLELYRMTKNKHTGESKLILPNVDPRRPLHYFIRLEEVRALEVEIDQMVHMLESLKDDAPEFDITLLVGKAKPKPKTSTTPETSIEEDD